MTAPAFVHPTALVEAEVTLGPGTSVWDNAHLRRGAVVGRANTPVQKRLRRSLWMIPHYWFYRRWHANHRPS